MQQLVKTHCQREARCTEKTCPPLCAKYKDTYRRTKNETKSVVCKLTDDELRNAGSSLAVAFSDLSLIEGEEKEMKQQYSAKKAEKEAQIAKLAALVRAGQEMRDVSCETITDYVNATVYTIRKDNKETIESREMRDDERQRHMDFLSAIDAEREAKVDAEKKAKAEAKKKPAEKGKDETAEPKPNEGKGPDPVVESPAVPDDDQLRGLFLKAVSVFKKAGRVGSATAMRKMKLTQPQALLLLALMETDGLVSAADGEGVRTLTVT